MDIKNRQHNIQKILLRAWRERWPEYQFGIKIKQALPLRLPADAYNLTDVLLDHCFIGFAANRLLLSYLKHSLHSHLVSYPAVIKRITKYSNFDRYYCLIALIDFLISIENGICCRTKPEESSLMNAVLSLVHWLIELCEKIFLKSLELNSSLSSEQKTCLEKITKLCHQICQNQYLMGVIYLAKLEDRELYEKCVMSYTKIHTLSKEEVVKDFYQMIFSKLSNISMKTLEPRSVEPISYCLQPFMSIEVLINASAEINVHVSKFLMIQKIKKYSMARLYAEIIRSCFITLCHVKDVNYRVWGAFTLYKIPLILKQLHMQNKRAEETDYSEDVVKAFEMLLECTPILDLLDTTFGCNSIECLLIELKKEKLVNDDIIKRLADKRQHAIAKLEKFNIPSTLPSIDKYVLSIDPPLSGLIQSLREPIKPEFHNLLCTLVIDNRAFLLYSVAAVKGISHKMINGLMKCNESVKEISSEAAKSKQIYVFRSNIFDTSFIMLFSIMQKCGIDKFPEIGGDYFFAKWIRDGMIDPSKPKSPLSVVKMCDPLKVDELITYFSDSNFHQQQQQPPISLKLSEICWNIPSMLYNVLIAWENDTIKPQTVKNILDNMRSKMCCFAIVAASWLSEYMKILKEDELSKPKVMVQTLMKPLDDTVMKQETFTERFTLTQEIIMKIFDTRSSIMDSKKPMTNLFNEQWKEIVTRKWLPYDVAINLEEILKTCGPFWLMKNLVDQIIHAKFVKDMEYIMDISFAVMHLNIDACTESLLKDILVSLFFNKNQMSKLTEPQLKILAKLSVYSILASMESYELSPSSKKRPRSDDDDLSPMLKMRKTGLDTSVEGNSAEKDSTSHQIKESLKNSLQELFKVFHQQVVCDELSPKVVFIFQFYSLLIQFEKSVKIKSILKLIPNGLLMNLLKLIPCDDLSYGFILRLYDLSVSSGRSSAIGDLCLLMAKIRKASSTRF